MSSLPSFDRRLVGRIRNYMSDHRRVAVDQMSEDLQQIHWRDYGRRKRGAFRNLVKQVHRLILEEGSKQKKLIKIENHHLSKRRKEDTDHSDSAESDAVSGIPESQENSMNSSITSLYKQKKKQHLIPSSPFRYIDCPTPKSTTSEPENRLSLGTRKGPNLEDESDEIEMTTETIDFEQAELRILTDYRDSGENVSSNFTDLNGFLEEDQSKPNDKKMKLNSRSKKLRKNKRKPKNENPETENKEKEGKSSFTLQASNVKFDDIGGNEKTLREVCNLLIHIQHPELYKALGVIPPCGVLLHGPPGCGKSLLASAIAGELAIPMVKIAATEIVSGVSGESEQKLRDLFELALSCAPCIIFIDEIDAITPKREIASKDMERRIVAQLLSCLDELNKSPSQILVIGATNRPDAIDPALRRAGRFDREICLGIPNEKAREDILRVLCKKLKLEFDFKYSMLARLTPGYVGADLMSLCREAAMCAVNRVLITMKNIKSKDTNYTGETLSDANCDFPEKDVDIFAGDGQEGERTSNMDSSDLDKSESTQIARQSLPIYEDYTLTTTELLSWLRETTALTEEQLGGLYISFLDFEQALPSVQPSAQREGFATVPNVTWDDVGALEDVRDELTVAILAPVRNPAAFSALGLTKPPGILLAGPPGCGKTLLAKAIANESGINFISVKGPELLNMYVGESERAVRQCFERARNSAPCVVFFDELDSICPRRSGHENSSTVRVVNQMLTEMDGLETRGHVFVMAATNRPDIIDPAVLRPGRLDKTLYVGLPNMEDRLKILQTITKNGTKPPISSEVSLEVIAKDERCGRFTGADLSSLVREAAVNALRDIISRDHVFEKDTPLAALKVVVKTEHFDKAFKSVRPSVSIKDELSYQKMKLELQT